MKRRSLGLNLIVFALVCSFPVASIAQQITAAETSTIATETSTVPKVVNYSGTLTDLNGKPLTGVTGVTFLLYKDAQGGAPLWLETQNVQPSKAGHYSVTLGSTTSRGLPQDVFVSGEARWLGVQIEGQAEQPRVLLVAVPYALKAHDAETIGGLPASAFMLAAPAGNASANVSSDATTTSGSVVQATTSNVTTTGGTANTIPLFTTATNIQNSILTQTGTTAINVHGKLILPALGTATATKGFNSEPNDFVASVYNSGTATAVPQTFQLQAEPLNNNKSTASGTLNLLYASGTATPAETGLKISNKGLITFASGQTFPGAGTVTSVTAGAGLAGGTITKSGTISIAAGGVTNTDLAHSSLTVTAGADLTGGGLVSLGSSTTLNLDTTKVPLLAAANTFTTDQTVNGIVTASALSTSGINSFDPGFSDFFGSEPSYVVIVGNDGGGNGIISENNATSGTGAGVYASASSSTQGIGVFGQSGSESGSAGTVISEHGNTGVGVWADGGTTSANIAVIGTVDDGPAAWFLNNSPSGWDTVFIQAQNGAASPFYAENSANGSFCYVDPSGNLNCSGSKNAVVPIDGGARTVAMSAIEAPQNWFEDAGSAELVNGVALVTLDRDFTQTVNTEMDYKVFPVPNGDCKGLYVTNKTATSFEVRELGGGTSNVRFDYRIMALRRKYENVRFADHSHDLDRIRLMHQRMGMKVAPHPHTPNKNLQQAAPRARITPTATKSQTR